MLDGSVRGFFLFWLLISKENGEKIIITKKKKRKNICHSWCMHFQTKVLTQANGGPSSMSRQTWQCFKSLSDTYIFILYMFHYQFIVQKLTVNYWVTGNPRTASTSAKFALSHTSFPTHCLAPSFRAQLSALSWLLCEADHWTLFKNT